MLYLGFFEIEKKKTLEDILEKDVDAKHYAFPEIVAKRKAMHTVKVSPSIWHENKVGNIRGIGGDEMAESRLRNVNKAVTPFEMNKFPSGFVDTFMDES